jgi:hypothetical protein
MLGAEHPDDIGALLKKLLYNEGFSDRLVRGAEGRAAALSAEAILALKAERQCAD